MSNQKFGKGKTKNEYQQINQESIKVNEIIINRHNVTNRFLLGFAVIFMVFLYIIFQERSCILYCDKNLNFCEIRRESNIGIRSSRDLFSPDDIKDVVAKLNFTERFVYGPIKLKRTGNRVYHSIYIVNPKKNQIPIFTKYDNRYKNSFVEKKMVRIAKEIKKELKDEKKDIIIYNITKAYKKSR